MEFWKPINGFEGLYEVSNLGNVRSLTRTSWFRRKGKTLVGVRKQGGIRKQHPDSRGNYMMVGLSKNGRTYMKLVHRLVAEAFIENPFDYSEVNHIDENKRNNKATNLEWCTHTYNNNYGRKLGLNIGEKNPQAKFSRSIIDEMLGEYIAGDSRFGLTQMARKYGISVSHVCSIVHGRRRANG